MWGQWHSRRDVRLRPRNHRHSDGVQMANARDFFDYTSSERLLSKRRSRMRRNRTSLVRASKRWEGSTATWQTYLRMSSCAPYQVCWVLLRCFIRSEASHDASGWECCLPLPFGAVSLAGCRAGCSVEGVIGSSGARPSRTMQARLDLALYLIASVATGETHEGRGIQYKTI